MEILTRNHKRDPNQMVQSVYSGVAPGGRTVTTIVKPSADRNRMEATRLYGPGLPRGQGGRVAVLVLGGMETTLDEVEDIVAAAKAKKFVQRRSYGEIVDMCRLVADRRNEQIMDARAHPSKVAAPRRRVRLHLPVGFKYVGTNEPGMKVAVRA